jgi:hypothetical protein
MMSWLVEAEVLTGERKSSEARTFYTAVLAELIKLDVFDADFHGEIQHGPVYIAVAVDTEDFREALARAFTAIRTAIHAAGGSTRNWPPIDDFPEPEVNGDGSWVIDLGGISQKPIQPVAA